MGRRLNNFVEEEWQNERYDIVVKGNLHKFNQNPALLAFLQSTDGRILAEASPVDPVWGIGWTANDPNAEDPYYWTGLNLLGFALMEVRDYFGRHGRFSEPTLLVEPPWKFHPEIGPEDLFWRMGAGEQLVQTFSRYYLSLDEEKKRIFALIRPEPRAWKGFYAD